MKPLSSPFFPLLAYSFLLPLTPMAASASGDSSTREVQLSFVQGDVRLSRGDGKHTDLNRAWEQALPGELIEQGFAIATEQGRAEIAFEDGSAVYLGENSLLLFENLSVKARDKFLDNDSAKHLFENSFLLYKELFSSGDHVVSRLALATGTATFSLQPGVNESFFIDTPTDHLELSPPETFFARIDAYLDATAITPQGRQGEHVVWQDGNHLQLTKGKTVFFQGGYPVSWPDRSESVPTGHEGALEMAVLRQTMPDFQLPAMAYTVLRKKEMDSSLELGQAAGDWDTWVSSRVERRSAVITAALKASGLTSPIAGLIDLYEQGSFFNCEPYGTCWEPTEPEEGQEKPQQSSEPITQSPAPAQTHQPFQPQTVQWQEIWIGCPPTLRTVTQVARTPEEFQRILRKKAVAERAMGYPHSYFRVCNEGPWIPYRHHYARVVTPQLPRHCIGAKCKPIHPPRPVWVRVGNKVGFVPAHPNDVKGKPPINLREGVLIPPSKPGARVERVALDPSQKFAVLDKPPREFRSEPLDQELRITPPEIHAHLMQEAARENSFSLSAHAAPAITYDYKSHLFLMPASTGARGKSKEVPVGGIDAHGKIGTFADGRHSSFAQSFGRSEAAGSYRAGSAGSSSGHGGYVPGYSAGGHGSSYSSGSYSSGSHSSGSGSSGASSSSHSSSGGGSLSSSGSTSSSSSSSSSSGGGSRGRP